MPITAPGRRAHGNKHRVCPIHRCREIGRKPQPPSRDIARHHILKARLVNGHLSALKHSDLCRVFVNADHIMPEIGKAYARYKANIACADHGDFHRIFRH
jgi:hypothetical protein